MFTAVSHSVFLVVALAYVALRTIDDLRGGVGLGRAILLFAGRILGVILLVGLSALLTGLGVNLLLSGVSLVVLAMVLNRRGRAQRDALLTLLAMAAERGMPLEPILSAFASECRGGYRRRLERLAELLRTGTPLADALAASPRTVPEQALCAARLGTQTGQLGKALRSVLTLTASRNLLWHRLISAGWLIFWPLFVLLAMLGLSVKFIYPQIARIVDDFGRPLPPLTQWATELSSSSTFNVVLVAFTCGLGLLLLYSVLAYIGWVPFGLPVIDRLLVRFESTHVLRHLGLVCDAGRPLSGGLELLAATYPTPWIRARLRRASERVQTGENWTDALAATRLVDATDITLLRAAEKIGNLGWALRLTADAGERRLSYRLLALSEILLPLMIVATGVLVLMMALNLFVPLTDLIEGLAE